MDTAGQSIIERTNQRSISKTVCHVLYFFVPLSKLTDQTCLVCVTAEWPVQWPHHKLSVTLLSPPRHDSTRQLVNHPLLFVFLWLEKSPVLTPRPMARVSCVGDMVWPSPVGGGWCCTAGEIKQRRLRNTKQTPRAPVKHNTSHLAHTALASRDKVSGLLTSSGLRSHGFHLTCWYWWLCQFCHIQAGLIHVSHLKAWTCPGGLAIQGGGKASTSFDLKNRNENHILIWSGWCEMIILIWNSSVLHSSFRIQISAGTFG